MSIEVAPMNTPPLVTRPLAPSRAKRHSFSPSLLLHNPVSQLNETPISSPLAERSRDGIMGGLRERSEDEINRASRGALEVALKEEWQLRDRLMTKIEELETGQRTLGERYEVAVTALAGLHARTDEAFTEQGRLEADLQARDEVLERLRGRVKHAERETREVQKRYAEQERSFEAERAALQKQEQHLQTRIKTLQAPRPRRSTSPPPQHADTRHLEEELDSLRMSHSTLLAQLNTLTHELHEVRIQNTQLVEENQGWEFLVRERTFNGQVRSSSGLLGHGRDRTSSSSSDGEVRKGNSQLDALDEEMEAEMEELHSDLEAHSPIFDDHDDLSPGYRTSSDSSLLAPPINRRKSSKSKGETLQDGHATGSGLDLAAELGRAEVDLDAGETRVLGKGDESDAMRAEVKQLREANKALNLYCSKILDRIIAQEGFEHVLSVDYKTRRMGTRSLAAAPTRGSLKDITNAMTENQANKAEVRNTEKKARPLSMMVRAMTGVGAAGQGENALVDSPKVEEKKEELKNEKRARRGFSIDFRSLGFGSPSPIADPNPTPPVIPGLKPLTLSTRASPVFTPKASAPRKLEPHVEDEEDRRERSRLEATLKLMGIDRPSPSPSDDSPQSVSGPLTPSSSYWMGKKLVKSRPTSEAQKEAVSVPDPKRGSPLSRLSEALGMGVSPLSPPTVEDVLDPMANIPSPERVAAAFRAYDQREAEQAKALAKGTAKTGYTSPPSGSIQRASLRRQNSSGEEGQKGVPKSESRSTLWSLGEGGTSRPTSGEVILQAREG
ncbi:hypothetical protein BCR39DRAFT_555091 [Naematelia encephala]|uniref:Uncharacterized protein n=1 Tax=Naematelia encephala TaxID=71784 RepID=A0A1Y2AEE7_9TREE|nr:hypothetical protein BCR39DRAFT_555091 [Naematelia encephala]